MPFLYDYRKKYKSIWTDSNNPIQTMFPTFKGHKKTKYLVMVEWANAPKVRHEKMWEAKIEAIRLAKETGKPTFLLQVLKKYDMEVTEISYKNEIKE